ncbi:MAG TPA: (Na+)-NQR maturation NqrM [Steroidobacteraceae bacterium]|nr:(Na+)-NQR maturation NqrM [Steroidobacteraceae bacterium]
MGTIAASVLVFALAFLGLALGVLAGRSPISGSCGGLNRIPGIDRDCACERPCPRRLREIERERPTRQEDRPA